MYSVGCLRHIVVVCTFRSFGLRCANVCGDSFCLVVEALHIWVFDHGCWPAHLCGLDISHLFDVKVESGIVYIRGRYFDICGSVYMLL